jgi:hypothetical protein
MRFTESASRADALERAGRDWAKIVKVSGGWMFFESLEEWRRWKAQK